MSLQITEQLAQETPDDRVSDSPGCYALEIPVPDGRETIAREWLAHFETLPPYFAPMCDAERVIYVGAAKSVRDRIDEHCQSDVRKATLPSVFGVDGLVRVWWFGSMDEAMQNEYNCAAELNRELNSAYAHSR